MFCLTKLTVVWEGRFKRGFGGGLAVVGRDASYPGILAASHVKDPLLPTVLYYLQEKWEQPCSSHLQDTEYIKNPPEVLAACLIC